MIKTRFHIQENTAIYEINIDNRVSKNNRMDSPTSNCTSVTKFWIRVVIFALRVTLSVESKGNSTFKDLWNIVDSSCLWIPKAFWYSRNFSGNVAFTSIPDTELSANRHSRYISRAYRLFEINQSLQNLNITFWAYVLVFITLSKVLNSRQSFYLEVLRFCFACIVKLVRHFKLWN